MPLLRWWLAWCLRLVGLCSHCTTPSCCGCCCCCSASHRPLPHTCPTPAPAQMEAVRKEAAAAAAALEEKVSFLESDKHHLGHDLKEAKAAAQQLREQVAAAQAAQADAEKQMDRLTQHLDSTEVRPALQARA